MKDLVKSGRLKIPEGVYRELRQKTDKLANVVEQWEKKYHFVVNLDYRALELLPDIERKYGPQFNIGGKNYPGFWKSPSGRKSVDAQVMALAKTRGWIVVSNDNSIHGACMLEDIACRRWEEIGRLLLGPEQPHLPGLEPLHN
ncbi:MAG: PIN domain-containing protein [Chloroflexi bacterium]|nr:PIN domain-containing protein [Chloroflexota bacterium]